MIMLRYIKPNNSIKDRGAADKSSVSVKGFSQKPFM